MTLPESIPTTTNADETLRDADSLAWRRVRHVAALIGVVLYLAYLVYRGVYTINPHALWFSLAVYGAEIHGLFSLIFYYFQIWTLRTRAVRPPTRQPSVDVFITTFNEEIDLLRQTVRSAIQMRYPHRTFVLDDGRRAEVRALCEEVGAEYLTREDNAHAKAGNWNHAFARTSAELIATFDADHVPRADFLERTLGFFDDPKVALVQVPQRYHNLDSLQHRVSWRERRMYGEQDVFFNLVMPGKDHWNSAFFCGTGAVLRREALKPYGGLLTGTITEDMHTSLALQADGWKSVYLNELLVTGLAPMDFASYTSQRLRWAEGNLKIIRYLNPLTARGLSFPQRVSYFASMYHWTIGFAKVVFYLAPPLILFTGQFPIARFDGQFIAIYAAHLLAMVGSYKVLSRGTGRLVMDEVFNMANFFTLLVAAKRFVLGRGEGIFIVTNKRGGTQSERVVLPQHALIVFTVAALVWSWLSLAFGVTDDLVGVGVASFWSAYNLSLMVAVVGFARRPQQRRQAVRFRTAVPVEHIDRMRRIGVTLDISEGGCTLLWPQQLPVGSTLALRLHLGPQVVSCEGEVRSVHGRRHSSWVAHGVQFRHIDQRSVDAIADAVYNMTVPEMFSRLTQPSWFVRQWRRQTMRLFASPRIRAVRQESFLPVAVEDAQGEFLATTRDLSVSGLSVVAPRRVERGTLVRVRLMSGSATWSSMARVVRCTEMPAPRPDYTTWNLGLRVTSADVRGLAGMLAEEAA